MRMPSLYYDFGPTQSEILYIEKEKSISVYSIQKAREHIIMKLR
jgi:hypothetical protein